MPISVLPQPAPPQTSVGRPRGKPAAGDDIQAVDAGGAFREPGVEVPGQAWDGDLLRALHG